LGAALGATLGAGAGAGGDDQNGFKMKALS